MRRRLGPGRQADSAGVPGLCWPERGVVGWGASRPAPQSGRYPGDCSGVVGSGSHCPEGPHYHAVACPGVSTPKSLCVLTFAPGRWALPASRGCWEEERAGGLGAGRFGHFWVPVLLRGTPQRGGAPAALRASSAGHRAGAVSARDAWGCELRPSSL